VRVICAETTTGKELCTNLAPILCWVFELRVYDTISVQNWEPSTAIDLFLKTMDIWIASLSPIGIAFAKGNSSLPVALITGGLADDFRVILSIADVCCHSETRKNYDLSLLYIHVPNGHFLTITTIPPFHTIQFHLRDSSSFYNNVVVVTHLLLEKKDVSIPMADSRLGLEVRTPRRFIAP